MFGENSIYGQTMVHYDEKQRIVLPKFTGVETNEELLVANNEDYLSVYKEIVFDKLVKGLENQYVNGDMRIKKEIDKELLKLYSSILKKVKVDSLHRINLASIKTNKDEFLCIGAKDRVILETKCIGIK